MIGPWKRIAELEHDLRAAQSDIAFARSQRDDMQARFDKVLETMLALKLKGAEPPPAVVNPVAEVSLPGNVLSEIKDKARIGTPLYWELYTDAVERLANGAEESEVAYSIRRGGAAPEGYD